MTTKRDAVSVFLSLSLASATALACNGILGASDYKVGNSNGSGDDGGNVGPGGDSGGGTGTGGTAGKGSGGASNTGGSSTGSGGVAGKGSGGRSSGGSGAAGSGAGGSSAGGVAGAGMGGTAGASTGGPGAFVGAWTTDSETLHTDCGDGMPTTDTGSDEIDWTVGPTSGTIQTLLPAANCILVATVSGKVATLPKTTCMDTSGITYVASGTFLIQTDGSARLVETVTVSGAGAICTIDATGIFMKN